MRKTILILALGLIYINTIAQFTKGNLVLSEVKGTLAAGELVKLIEVRKDGTSTGKEVLLGKEEVTDPSESIPKHYKVWYQDDKYAGWPANFGIWRWGNEVLTGFATANYDGSQASHPYEPNTQVYKFSRSLDGGKTWATEDAYVVDETLHPANTAINFNNANFALAFRLYDDVDGKRRSTIYHSYNKGLSWSKPKEISVTFPWRASSLILTRTDYIIDGPSSATAFLTVGFSEYGDNTRREVVCIRTVDGGLTWNAVSIVGSSALDLIMPSSIRLSSNSIFSVIRRSEPAQMKAYRSNDNGATWIEKINPVKVDMNGHPPALLKLADGRLCLLYAIRFENTLISGSGIYVVYSSDEGETWTTPKRIRGNDGNDWDIGYPRATQMPDGDVLVVYYYNHANAGNPYRYIAATLFKP